MTDKGKECKNTTVDALMRLLICTESGPGSYKAKQVRLISQTRFVYLLLYFSKSCFYKSCFLSSDSIPHAALIPDFDQPGIVVPCSILPVDLQVFAVKFDLV